MTGNLRAVTTFNGIGDPPLRPYLNAKSTTIQGGDWVVVTTAAADTTASNPVVRTLIQDDIDDLYESPIAGVLGIAKHDAVTTSGGVASTQWVYASKAAAAEPTTAIPSYGMGQPPDPNISYTQMMVFVATPDVIYRGKLASGQTGSNLLLGTTAGITITAALFTVDTGATTKILNIVGWDPSNTAFVYFTVQAAYCQLLTSVAYAD
jgi:hypothetical protein